MIISKLSRFLFDLKYEDIPEEAIEMAKLCFLDYLAVYNRGLKSENAQIAIKTVLQLYHNDLDLLNRGLIAGIASHSLDLDDGHRLAHLHPGVVVFSSAMAIISDNELKNDGDAFQITTKQFFEAVVGAYEIAIVLGEMMNPVHRNQGFHSTGTIGAIASAACASKLLDLDLGQTINALGLATTQASGLLESDHAGTMGKTLHVGKAVYNGLLSAFLANNGFTGGESIIDGDEGLIRAMARDSEYVYPDISKNFLDENLGRFHINEVYLKKYPFCRHIHSTIDSILALKDYINEHGMDINCIDEIKVETYKIASEHNDFSPKNKEELKQSLPYAVAIALVCDEISIDMIDLLIEYGLFEDLDNFIDLDEISLMVRRIKDIADKISIYYDSSLDEMAPNKRASRVSLILNQYFGDEGLTHTTYYPLGELENPLTKDEILEKFYILNPSYDLERLKIIDDMEYFSLKDIFGRIGII